MELEAGLEGGPGAGEAGQERAGEAEEVITVSLPPGHCSNTEQDTMNEAASEDSGMSSVLVS